MLYTDILRGNSNIIASNSLDIKTIIESMSDIAFNDLDYITNDGLLVLFKYLIATEVLVTELSGTDYMKDPLVFKVVIEKMVNRRDLKDLILKANLNKEHLYEYYSKLGNGKILTEKDLRNNALILEKLFYWFYSGDLIYTSLRATPTLLTLVIALFFIRDINKTTELKFIKLNPTNNELLTLSYWDDLLSFNNRLLHLNQLTPTNKRVFLTKMSKLIKKVDYSKRSMSYQQIINLFLTVFIIYSLYEYATTLDNKYIREMIKH